MDLEFIKKYDATSYSYLQESLDLRKGADDLIQKSQSFARMAMKTIRGRMGLSANNFGKLCGVTPQYIFALEAGRAKWNDRMILKLEQSLRQKEAALASEDLQSGSEA